MIERFKKAAVAFGKWVVALALLLAGIYAATRYHRANRARTAALEHSARLLREREIAAARRAQVKHAEAELHLAKAAEAKAAAAQRIRHLRENNHETMAALVERWNRGPDGLRDDTH